jgi:hypothetical protein
VTIEIGQPENWQPENWQPSPEGGSEPPPSSELIGLAVPQLFVQHPSAQAAYLFDWSEFLGEGQAITGVTYTVPAPLEQYVDTPDLSNSQSLLGIRNVPHASMNQILALASRSDGAAVAQLLVIRGFNG